MRASAFGVLSLGVFKGRRPTLDPGVNRGSREGLSYPSTAGVLKASASSFIRRTFDNLTFDKLRL
jgi:hypothetical protein